MKLSKLALKNNATNGMRHGSTAQNVRAAGRITSRLSLLELCICLKDVQAFQHLNNIQENIMARPPLVRVSTSQLTSNNNDFLRREHFQN